MWRPADPEVVNKIVCEMKHKFIRHTNKIFAPDKAFLRMKEEQTLQTFTPILYTVPPKSKVSIQAMRALCTPWEKGTLVQLRKLAQEHGVKGYYKYTKAQLIEAVRRKLQA